MVKGVIAFQTEQRLLEKWGLGGSAITAVKETVAESVKLGLKRAEIGTSSSSLGSVRSGKRIWWKEGTSEESWVEARMRRAHWARRRVR